ncbi:MAG: hypothetical protein EG826_00905 [Deltaproteobacteria bacterium]|nr:hypothetical protein [Deltaproteobacteria bacterium]
MMKGIGKIRSKGEWGIPEGLEAAGAPCYRARPENAPRERGIALIMVLWVMAIIIVVTFSLSLTVRTELFSINAFKEEIHNKLLAEAGLQRGIMEIHYRRLMGNKVAAADEGRPCRADGTLYKGRIGEDDYAFSLTDESGKININLLSDSTGVILNNLLVGQGVDKTLADTIVDSLLDWKDADDLQRLHGAESDYYQRLPRPYRAKNAGLDSPEELLFVKGMTTDILYGDERKPGLIRFITVSSGTNRININTAAADVLRALPFMSEDSVKKIMDYRLADNSPKDGSALPSLLGSQFAPVAQFVTTADSGVYTVEATGYRKENKKIRYGLKAVVSLAKGDRHEISYYQSPSRMRPSLENEL